MVELENDRIGLAAVGARVQPEVLDEPPGSVEHQPLLLVSRLVDVALPVRFVMCLAVFGPAGTAKRIALPAFPSPPGELLHRLDHPASGAPQAVVFFSHYEHTFPL